MRYSVRFECHIRKFLKTSFTSPEEAKNAALAYEKISNAMLSKFDSLQGKGKEHWLCSSHIF